MKFALFFLLIFLVSCSTKGPVKEPVKDPVPVLKPDELNGEMVNLWATFYYSKVLEPSDSSHSVPLRDMNDEIIGPYLSYGDWCKAAIEGTVIVNGVTYNYAGVKSPTQTKCSHKPSERVRWKKTDHKFGIGNKSNPLIPFKSLACDQGTVRNSKPLPNGKFLKFGQKIFIPDAKGVKLPNGEIHDGIFRCDDTGGKITGNHIDVYLGAVTGGLNGALKLNPFPFIKSSSSYPFKAMLINE